VMLSSTFVCLLVCLSVCLSHSVNTGWLE